MIIEALKEHIINTGPDILLKNTVIGVLALQGAFREHISAINKCGAAAREIKFPYQLDSVDGLVTNFCKNMVSGLRLKNFISKKNPFSAHVQDL
jgi:hypothetical protein